MSSLSLLLPDFRPLLCSPEGKLGQELGVGMQRRPMLARLDNYASSLTILSDAVSFG